MSGTKERVKELLAAGVTQGQAADALGVDESYVSQLMAEESFRQEVLEARASRAVDFIEHDGRIHDLEAVALEKVRKLLDFETNINRALRVFQVANAAKKRSDISATPQQPATIVNISLPQTVLVDFKMTSQREVVEVDGRSLATMPSHVVQAKLRQQQANLLLTDKTKMIDEKMASKLAQF